MEKGLTDTSSPKELFTPEALRRAADSGQIAPTRPGEKTPSGKSKVSESKSPPKSGHPRLRRCGQSLYYVPWWALMSLTLLVGGLTIFAIKGMAAADAAHDLLAAIASNTNTGFPKYMDVYKTSVWVTVGVAGAAVVGVVLAASVRLDQKLRKKGRYGAAKGSYGGFVYKFFASLSWLGLVLVMLLSMWSVVLGVLLSSWATQCWNLETGCSVAGANMAALDSMGTQYSKALDDFATAIMATASNTTGAALNATVAPGIDSLKLLSNTLTASAGSSSAMDQQAADGACPSVACLNMALYPFTESTACACTASAMQTVHDLAKECSSATVWALIAAAALFGGSMLGCMELAGDIGLLEADQLFLTVIKRKSSSRGSSRSGRRDSDGQNYRTLSPGAAAVPAAVGTTPFSMHANASYN